MRGYVRRRDLICLLGGAAIYWPCAAPAQQVGVPVVGYLFSAVPDASWLAGFRDSLKSAGYVYGHNIVLEGHSAEGQYDVRQGGRLVVRTMYHERSTDVLKAIHLTDSGNLCIDATRFSNV